MIEKGSVYIVSAPSGAGKTSLIKAFLLKKNNYEVSISHTTRTPRSKEINGQDYFFVTEKIFKEIIDKGEFIEWAKVFNHYYGTSQQAISNVISKGKNIILEIDWQGATQIKKIFPQCFSIFIMPPSTEGLYQRLIKRGQDSQTVITHRMTQAEKEMSYVKRYDCVIVNNSFNTALEELCAVICT